MTKSDTFCHLTTRAQPYCLPHQDNPLERITLDGGGRGGSLLLITQDKPSFYPADSDPAAPGAVGSVVGGLGFLFAYNRVPLYEKTVFFAYNAGYTK